GFLRRGRGGATPDREGREAAGRGREEEGRGAVQQGVRETPEARGRNGLRSEKTEERDREKRCANLRLSARAKLHERAARTVSRAGSDRRGFRAEPGVQAE